MSTDRNVTVLADVIRASLDDCRVRLGPRTEQALITRVGELLELGGYVIVHQSEGGADAWWRVMFGELT